VSFSERRCTRGGNPYVWLGPRWYAWLEFGPGGSHAAFERLADRLCTEFGGVRAEALPSPAEAGKEYLYLRFGPSELLLMRRDEWIGLGAFYPDLPHVLRIGAAFGAVRRGWRWPLYRAWRWLVVARPDAEPSAADVTMNVKARPGDDERLNG
jgi:hypothetical protein